ncbi:MAG: vitamin K epoxide reductase family protein [Phycisphaerales bacterium JB063]
MFIALLLAAYLAWQGFTTAQLAGCGEGTGCDVVLNSAWSKVFGVPVGLFAAVNYGVMLGLTFALTPKRSAKTLLLAGRLLVILSVATILAISWFVALQVFVIEELCKYCLADHAAGLVAAVLVLFLVGRAGRQDVAVDASADDSAPETQVSSPSVPGPAPALSWQAFAVCALIGLLCTSAFAGVQVAFKPKLYQTQDIDLADTFGGDGREISLSGGRYTFYVNQLPLLGSPDAEHIMIAMVDYQCPHCRTMNERLQKAMDLYGDQVAIIFLPMPLDSECNPGMTGQKFAGSCELGRLCLAVGRESPEAYVKFHQWLFNEVPSLEVARRYAEKLVGAERLNAHFESGWVNHQLTMDINAHRDTGGGGVPKLFIGSQVITGSVETDEELFKLLENNYNLRARGWDGLGIE